MLNSQALPPKWRLPVSELSGVGNSDVMAYVVSQRNGSKIKNFKAANGLLDPRHTHIGMSLKGNIKGFSQSYPGEYAGDDSVSIITVGQLRGALGGSSFTSDFYSSQISNTLNSSNYGYDQINSNSQEPNSNSIFSSSF